MPGLYYEEFEEGQTIEHRRRRTVSESDNQRFCDMTMNQQPLHLDEDFTADTQFGQRLVNGLYTMSLAVGITIPETTDGTIVANLSYDDVEHPNPVFHGDTIRVQSTVTDKRETSSGERGLVTMRVEAFVVDADEDRLVDATDDEHAGSAEELLACEFERTVLSLKREHAE
ncbi:MaoC family dehydratase [Halorubellus salinus]|uniref:MaoC family dehydratase n=1 Tax=Halorubellus salinus TaxID=755309 RepID=UPI001D05DE37|nr:MaoC family dehydratase [Halorubellus salinus]